MLIHFNLLASMSSSKLAINLALTPKICSVDSHTRGNKVSLLNFAADAREMSPCLRLHFLHVPVVHWQLIIPIVADFVG